MRPHVHAAPVGKVDRNNLLVLRCSAYIFELPSERIYMAPVGGAEVHVELFQ